jgi:hypothetical protein
MTRTTIDIDAPILDEIKEIQKKEGKALGKLVSELLLEGLAKRRFVPETTKFNWISKPMQALVDLADKEALFAILDRKEE